MRSANLNTILLVVLSVVGTVLVMTLFRKTPANEKAIRNEEKVKALEEKLKFKDSVYKETVAILDSQITYLTDKILINKASIQQSNDRIKTLPARISSMSIDDVIRTIEQ